MPDRYPGYDVLARCHTPSWNEQTHRVIDARLVVAREPRFVIEHGFTTVTTLAKRIVPEPTHRPQIPVAALVYHKLFQDKQDGYRQEGMPQELEAWQRGLRALDAEARAAHGSAF